MWAVLDKEIDIKEDKRGKKIDQSWCISSSVIEKIDTKKVS